MSKAAAAIEHVPVMAAELVAALDVVPGGSYVDCTVDGGGHASVVLEASAPGGRLLGIDADPRAVRSASRRLASWKGAFLLVNENFSNLAEICAAQGFSSVNGVYFDLGLSTPQLEEAERGFSFQREAALDMRFSDRQVTTAADIVNTYPLDELARVLWTYGEERRSRSIARRIVSHRPVRTTTELADLVRRAVPGGRQRIHPATRTFQALRILVNEELGNLEAALKRTLDVLGHGGRVVVLSYHSLEDRLVKRWFRQESIDCLCPPEVLVCVCGHKATLGLVTKRVVTPSAEEIAKNPRSRSAKLRAAALL